MQAKRKGRGKESEGEKTNACALTFAGNGHGSRIGNYRGNWEKVTKSQFFYKSKCDTDGGRGRRNLSKTMPKQGNGKGGPSSVIKRVLDESRVKTPVGKLQKSLTRDMGGETTKIHWG